MSAIHHIPNVSKMRKIQMITLRKIRDVFHSVERVVQKPIKNGKKHRDWYLNEISDIFEQFFAVDRFLYFLIVMWSVDKPIFHCLSHRNLLTCLQEVLRLFLYLQELHFLSSRQICVWTPKVLHVLRKIEGFFLSIPVLYWNETIRHSINYAVNRHESETIEKFPFLALKVRFNDISFLHWLINKLVFSSG